MSKTTDPGASIGTAARTASAGRAAELARAVARRAEADGLADVAYTTADSPFGTLTLAATEEGLVTLGLPNLPTDQVLETLSAKVSPRVLEAPARLDDVRRELDLYFEGQLKRFDVPLDWRLSSGFRQKVLRQIDRIPFGQTRSYREMAAGAGNERAVRAAGSACGSNPIPIIVPCHRVLRTGGGLGGYGGGLELKEELLRLEGVL
jgi:methylated-DNA-[protein]-cysteine S-methyltransferase